MDKRIVFALAGSGKTHYITHDFKENERVYLISFTNRNVDNIRDAVRERFEGKIPSNVMVSTFDSFVYSHLIKPVECLIVPTMKALKGTETQKTPVNDSRKPSYIKDNKPKHYISNNRLFVNRMSKLVIKQESETKRIMLKRIEMCCDAIYFDEFQDYNGRDYELLRWIVHEFQGKVVCVGDIYQSLVRPKRIDVGGNLDKPFESIKSYDDLGELGLKKNIELITEELQVSRRISENVACFIREHIGIPIWGQEHEGKVIEVESFEQLDGIMKDEQIVKLVWDRKSVCENMKNHVNWSYSKGDTYQDACVVLTKAADNIEAWNELKISTRNKLYVALTRARRNVYLVHAKLHAEWKSVQLPT